MKKTGSTWWGKRWIDALEAMSASYSSRLARGRTYARTGRTHDLVIKTGEVTARVTGSSPWPYEITIRLSKLEDAAWEKAIFAMSEKAQFTAELLGGQMPKDIDEAFRSASVSLFPANEKDLVTKCSCPDWANPCKHIAATHYVLGEAFDRDPFLLFELRGRTKEQVLTALRSARGGDVEARTKHGARSETKRARPENAEIPTVKLGKLSAADYDTPSEALPELHLTFDAPAASGAVLRQLGVPASWSRGALPADTLASIVHAAAEHARTLATAELSADASAPPNEPAPVRVKKKSPRSASASKSSTRDRVTKR